MLFLNRDELGIKGLRNMVPKIVFYCMTVVILFAFMTAHGEELPLICEIKEDLNFKGRVQTIYLRVDMEKKTVNGIPSTVLGTDIISYETEAEAVTFILPSMYLKVIRKGRGPGGADVSYTGACKKDELKF